MKRKQALIVDKDINMCELLRHCVSMLGFTADFAHDGEKALAMYNSERYDLVTLEVTLPKMNGWAICEKIRKHDFQCFIIFVTEKNAVLDRVWGLNLGADDYIVKPFESKEVTARIRALMRRSDMHMDNGAVREVVLDKLVVNVTNSTLKVNGELVYAPAKELALLYQLACNPNTAFSRDQLLDKVWGFDYCGDSRTVDVHIQRIRKKIKGVSENWELCTIWGVGYKFEVKRES